MDVDVQEELKEHRDDSHFATRADRRPETDLQRNAKIAEENTQCRIAPNPLWTGPSARVESAARSDTSAEIARRRKNRL